LPEHVVTRKRKTYLKPSEKAVREIWASKYKRGYLAYEFKLPLVLVTSIKKCASVDEAVRTYSNA